MKIILIILSLLTLLAFSEEKQKVFDKKIGLLPQWHLLPKNETNDIEASKKLPQYLNQKSIYLVIKEWIEQDRIEVIIAEGCEGEIDRNTQLKFNGWDFWKLYGRKELEIYDDILTHIPLKIEAKYGDKIKTICGDSNELIKKHQMLLSDMVGVNGFMMRIQEAKSSRDDKKLKLYHEGYEKLEGKKIPDILNYLEEKLKKLAQEEEQMVIDRNNKFIEVIKSLKEKKIAIVLGARHMQDLQKKLEELNYEVVNFPPILETLPNNGNL